MRSATASTSACSQAPISPACGLGRDELHDREFAVAIGRGIGCSLYLSVQAPTFPVPDWGAISLLGTARLQCRQLSLAEDKLARMPQVTIDGVTIEADRLMLLPAEVALVLRVDEKEVRNMIRRGELEDVSSDGRRRLDPNEVIDVVEKRVAKGELSPHVFVELAALIAGRL